MGPLPDGRDSPSGHDVALIEDEQLRQLVALDPDGSLTLVEQILAEFDANLGERFAQLATASVEGDADALGRVAHALRGGCLQFGMVRAASYCATLEEHAKRGETSGCGELVGMVTSAVTESVQLIPARLQAIREAPAK
ncbi:MAG TPA: Hpt domain-containing protein [Acidimicrobiales bacterium]|nr:Hpt domain-containing protein [Acidimicrobiales bacterium]